MNLLPKEGGKNNEKLRAHTSISIKKKMGNCDSIMSRQPFGRHVCFTMCLTLLFIIELVSNQSLRICVVKKRCYS